MNSVPVKIRLEPWAAEIEVPRGSALQAVLAAQGVEFPCGGAGICGGCRVRAVSGALATTPEDEAAFSASERAEGWRLACRARAVGPLVLECGQAGFDVLADSAPIRAGGRQGLGVAIDLGTTTIAVQLIDLSTGEILKIATALNQQVQFGADVMSRIGAVLAGSDLTTPIREQIGALIAGAADGRADSVREVILVGNTVMHHLFCGLPVEPLSHAPFESVNLSEQRFIPDELGWPLPPRCTVRFARCLGGFVGSDILAGIFAAGLGGADTLSALVDLGTNGEIAIGDRRGILCASTAAGPAFEAGAIRMGMRAAAGAVAHVSLGSAGFEVSVIGDVEPRGLCGSGVVDAVAAGLALGSVLPSGRMATPARTLQIAGPVALYQPDVRELQLAKAAIASGISLLLHALGERPERLTILHLAGAFGNYLHVQSAIDIGLFPLPGGRIHPAGNTALRGARMMLVSEEEPCLPPLTHVALASMANFQSEFERHIAFPATAAVRGHRSTRTQDA